VQSESEHTPDSGFVTVQVERDLVRQVDAEAKVKTARGPASSVRRSASASRVQATDL